MLSRAQIKHMSREQIKGNVGILFICMLLIGLITGASAITAVGPFILAPVFIISMARIYLNLTEGAIPEPKDIFSGFDVMGKAIILELMMGVFVFLWMLLLFIPGVVKAISYSMSPYILAENPDMTAGEALNESKRLTKGHKGGLLILMLSFFPWLLLTGITFGIAGVYVVPYVYTALANYYKELKAAAEYKL